MLLVLFHTSQMTRSPSRRMVTYRAPQQPAVQVVSAIMTRRGSFVTASGQRSAAPSSVGS